MADTNERLANLGEMLKAQGINLSVDNKSKERANPSKPKPGTVNKVVPKFKFEEVEIPEVEVSFQTKEERDANLEGFKKFSAKVAVVMHDTVSKLRKIQSMSEEEATIYVSDLQRLQDAITKMVEYDQPATREVAVIAYADALIRTCPDYRGWVKSTLEDLTHAGFMVKLPPPPQSDSKSRSTRSNGLWIYGENYDLHAVYAKNTQAQKVVGSLQNLIERTRSAEQERSVAHLAELKSEVGPTPLGVAELRVGKAGRVLLIVPDPKFESNISWLLVDSDGHRIVPLGADGSIEEKVDQLIKTGVYVPVKQIGAPRIQLEEKVEKDFYRDVLILDFMITRAISLVEKKARDTESRTKSNTERQQLASRATVTEVEFYLDSKPGVVFYDFGQEVFEMKIMADGKVTGKKPFHQVMALIERNDQHQIRVVERPERLNELFAGSREFMAEGEKFSGLGVLCALLRIGWAKTRSELSDEEKKLRQEAWEKTRSEKKAASQVQAQADAMQMAAGTEEDISGVEIPPIPEPKEESQRPSRSRPRKKTRQVKKARADR